MLKQLMLILRTILQVLILDRHFYFPLHSNSCFSFKTYQWKITLFLNIWGPPIKLFVNSQSSLSTINPISLRVVAMLATRRFLFIWGIVYPPNLSNSRGIGLRSSSWYWSKLLTWTLGCFHNLHNQCNKP